MDQTAEKVKEIVIKYIGEDLPDPDTDLVEEGMIQSLTMMNILMALEEEFHFETEATDIVRDNFRTIAAISALVGKYTGKE